MTTKFPLTWTDELYRRFKYAYIVLRLEKEATVLLNCGFNWGELEILIVGDDEPQVVPGMCVR